MVPSLPESVHTDAASSLGRLGLHQGPCPDPRVPTPTLPPPCPNPLALPPKVIGTLVTTFWAGSMWLLGQDMSDPFGSGSSTACTCCCVEVGGRGGGYLPPPTPPRRAQPGVTPSAPECAFFARGLGSAPDPARPHPAPLRAHSVQTDRGI